MNAATINIIGVKWQAANLRGTTIVSETMDLAQATQMKGEVEGALKPDAVHNEPMDAYEADVLCALNPRVELKSSGNNRWQVMITNADVRYFEEQTKAKVEQLQSVAATTQER